MRKNNANTSQRATSVVSTKGSSKPKAGSSVQHSGQDAVVPSTPTDRLSSGDVNELTMRVVCVVLECIMYETFSSDKLYLAFSRAKDKIDEIGDDRTMAIFEKLVLMSDDIHKRGPMYRMFGVCG